MNSPTSVLSLVPTLVMRVPASAGIYLQRCDREVNVVFYQRECEPSVHWDHTLLALSSKSHQDPNSLGSFYDCVFFRLITYTKPEP